MVKIDKNRLASLYKSQDINLIWNNSQSLDVIEHPTQGKISPNQYRSQYKNHPCPYCGQKMVHGPDHSTNSKSEAIASGYEYIDKDGKSSINFAGQGSSKRYFHPHYVTLDHKVNKARCPELMFNFENLQIMCWKCNNEKGDNNAYECQHNRSYSRDLSQATLKRYPLL